MADDIRDWLDGIGLGAYADAFAENKIDTSLLPSLTNDDLKDMGVAAVGDRRRILNAIAEMAKPVESAPSASARDIELEQARPVGAERRQLTVMFCDLVGSTELSRRLDPEDLREVMRRYQDVVSGVVIRFDGYVANFLGDGVLSYFGWPRAFEDQAERAVRAALQVLESLHGLAVEGEEGLRARIGIATGQVVIGDIVGKAASQYDAVVGETPNLAARLQEVAAVGTVVIDTTTQQLVGKNFALRELGRQQLKGFDNAVDAWCVLGEGSAESRFEATHAGTLMRLVGRENELALLRERWQLAKGGEGQVVFLSGEAGVGKSRLVTALREFVSADQHFRLRYQCSPFHRNSALYPVVQRLQRAARFFANDSTDAKLDKLESLLKVSTENIADVAPLFAALLTLPVEPRYTMPDLTPEQQRERMLAVLLEQALALSRQRPVLVVLEDAHWIDPTTQDLMGEMMSRARDNAILIVVTFRPEFDPPWTSQPHQTALALNRLSRDQSAEIVRNSGGVDLPAETVGLIIARADGVPLFLEELTKSVVEASTERGGDRDIAVPASLQSSLTARLDRLDRAKEIAQIGAVLGREFSHELLAKLTDMPEAVLNAEISRLEHSELVFRVRTQLGRAYRFKHALVQDAAYNSLLRADRRALHAKTADILEQDFPSTVESEPEILAYHFTEADKLDRAIDYWERAGLRASERSANKEAVSHLRHGLELLREIEAPKARAKRELGFLIELGVPLRMSEGVSAQVSIENYELALRIAKRIGDARQMFQILWGLWAAYRGRFEASRVVELADHVMEIAQREGASDLLMQAHHTQWTTAIFMGQYRAAVQHADLGTEIYDPVAHHDHALVYGGHDPCVCGHTIAGLGLWAMGFPEKAAARCKQAEDISETLSHPPSVAHAHDHTAMMYQLGGQAEYVLRHCDKAIAIAQEQELPRYKATAEIMRQWALVVLKDKSASLASVEDALSILRKTGFALPEPYYLGLLADAYLHLGRPGEGTRIVDRALDTMDATGFRLGEAGLLVLQAQLMLAADGDELGSAASTLQRAIDLAGTRNAKSYELRAATALADLWRKQRRNDEARALLAPIYEWFTEGFDTPDLKEAKALLNEL